MTDRANTILGLTIALGPAVVLSAIGIVYALRGTRSSGYASEHG